MNNTTDFLSSKSSHQEMSAVDYVVWADMRVCFPFTLLAIGLCYMVRFNPLIIYYLNLLTANLIQIITKMVYVHTADRDRYRGSLEMICNIISNSVFMVSVYIRMVIALERCFFICRPQQHCISQDKASGIICVLVWLLCLLIGPVLEFFHLRIVFIVSAAISSLVFIICPVVTCICLPGASSVSAEERRRSVAALLLLMVNYGVNIGGIVIWFLVVWFFYPPHYLLYVKHILILLGRVMDLILFVFMRKGPIDQLLTCLCCCCRMETSAVDDGSRLSDGL